MYMLSQRRATIECRLLMGKSQRKGRRAGSIKVDHRELLVYHKYAVERHRQTIIRYMLPLDEISGIVHFAYGEPYVTVTILNDKRSSISTTDDRTQPKSVPIASPLILPIHRLSFQMTWYSDVPVHHNTKRMVQQQEDAKRKFFRMLMLRLYLPNLSNPSISYGH